MFHRQPTSPRALSQPNVCDGIASGNAIQCVELRETEIETLVRQGLLLTEMRNDPQAVSRALRRIGIEYERYSSNTGCKVF